MSWRLLPRAVLVKVKRKDLFEPALAWAVNDETRELQVTMGTRIMRRADRPTRSELVIAGPTNWLSEDEPIPGLGVGSG